MLKFTSRLLASCSTVAIGLAAFSFTNVSAIDSVMTPRAVPLTRPEMKEYLEDMKGRTLRIPLPELTDADKEKLGERGSSYESRLRYHYMNSGDGQQGSAGQGRGGGGGGRDNDPDMSLDYAFKVQLFWIVSRTNNCQYCLGHQESKLLGAGMTEDEIAALDGDWSEFTPAERPLFTLARKLGASPVVLTDADVAEAVKQAGPRDVVQAISYTTGRASFDRITESAGLRVE